MDVSPLSLVSFPILRCSSQQCQWILAYCPLTRVKWKLKRLKGLLKKACICSIIKGWPFCVNIPKSSKIIETVILFVCLEVVFLLTLGIMCCISGISVRYMLQVIVSFHFRYHFYFTKTCPVVPATRCMKYS